MKLTRYNNPTSTNKEDSYICLNQTNQRIVLTIIEMENIIQICKKFIEENECNSFTNDIQ